MAHPLEHVEYLSKELGARPAGTEEEQNAALYIADQIQKETNFHAEIEEFTSSSNFPYVQAICCAVIVVVTVLAMFVPVLAIPAFVLGAVSAAIYALEAFDRPIVTRALARSASQNVVAKYQPNPAVESGSSKRGQRTRKIVLVAHYDSGKVVPGVVDKVESTGLPIGLICVGATVAAAFLLLIRIFIGNAAGVASIILNILSIVAILIALLPIAKAVLIQIAPYNEGANNNAAGVAAMMEVARRISRGSVSEADLVDEAEGVAIHGEAAAIANGLVPEGAEIRYEAERLTPPEMEPLDDEERLLSAKAAIAALTGKPVEKRVYGSVADHLVNTRSEGALHLDQQAAEPDFAPTQPEPEQQPIAAD
ncbi:MAG: aminopeptidase, partial [Eggerthellaceae bacterium]|nr:aminopeptidase [Eggerthellaceae bacterium]